MKAQARSFFWWPGLVGQLEECALSRADHVTHKNHKVNEILTVDNEDEDNFSVLH